MKVDKGFVLVVGLMVGCILAAFGNLIGYGIIAGMALTQACLTLDKASK
jgi:hypothetical protein